LSRVNCRIRNSIYYYDFPTTCYFLYVAINRPQQPRTFSDDNKRQCPNAVLASCCNYLHSVSWLSVFWQSHPYPVMSLCSKSAKLGPSTEAASAQLPERAQLLFARCLILLNDIDEAYFYEAIGTTSIPASLSHLLCVTDEQLMTIYRYCEFYNVKRNCFSETIFHAFIEDLNVRIDITRYLQFAPF
jgi:hypothetical protein